LLTTRPVKESRVQAHDLGEDGHRESGLMAMPTSMTVPLMLMMMRRGFSSGDELVQWIMTPPEDPAGYITESTATWELVHLVEMKYNRLVLYDARLFHSGFFGEDDFGSTDDSRRLTLNVFISNGTNPA
jgi:hypothetical protein